MNVGYRVTLTQYGPRNETRNPSERGPAGARRKTVERAQILLAADAGVGDEEIAASVGVGGLDGVPHQTAVRGGQPGDGL